jgi:hypothetical protein
MIIPLVCNYDVLKLGMNRSQCNSSSQNLAVFRLACLLSSGVLLSSCPSVLSSLNGLSMELSKFIRAKVDSQCAVRR